MDLSNPLQQVVVVVMALNSVSLAMVLVAIPVAVIAVLGRTVSYCF